MFKMNIEIAIHKGNTVLHTVSQLIFNVIIQYDSNQLEYD